jgi:putative flippase GtrA
MSEQVLSTGQVGMPEPVDLDVVYAPGESEDGAGMVKRGEPSYIPTGVAFLDSLMELVDGMTAGKAGVLQRAVSYLMVGGFAACVNLICLYIFNDMVPMPFPWVVHNIVAFLLAAEISILANFIPNDRITFSRLPGHARSWWMRCLRFHSTAIAGTLVTLIIFSVMHIWLGLHTLIAESTGIMVALVFNFTFHHIWTYRHLAVEH